MNRHIRIVQILCVSLTCGAPALAAQARRLCAGATAERPAAICYASVADSLEGRLDTLLVELRRALPSAAFSRLERAQTLWRASRDSLCTWESTMFSGGSIAPRIEATCEIAQTAERITTLKVFLCPGAPVMPDCAESRRYDVLPEP